MKTIQINFNHNLSDGNQTTTQISEDKLYSLNSSESRAQLLSSVKEDFIVEKVESFAYVCAYRNINQLHRAR